jgi:lipopolysaccharide transport system ATP-binding protein
LQTSSSRPPTFAIRAEGIGKLYRVGERARYKALRDSIAAGMNAPLRAARAVRRRDEESNGDGRREYVWALKDVSCELQPGEVVGVIGRNGSGKSTLLKVISRVTNPTEGQVELSGRVGSLLEVGTGFHAELTGRENVYLSGAILGMGRSEVRRKFDEIVEFAEVGRFIDTPIKRYSSGMAMRLGFAVAAHLETEILLVDEVLAVGDAEFQKRCIGRMGTFAHQGRTVLFVSHNMAAINRLCPRSLLLSEGRLVRDGPTPEVIPDYLRLGSEGNGERTWTDPGTAPGNDKVRLEAVRVESEGLVRGTVNIDSEISIEVEFWNRREGNRNMAVEIQVHNGVGVLVLNTANTRKANALEDDWFDQPHRVGLYRSTCTIPPNFLNEGRYYVTVNMVTLGPAALEVSAPEVVAFDVFDTGVMREAGGGDYWPGVVRPRLPWSTEFVESGV